MGITQADYLSQSYRFTLPHPSSIFGLPIGQHISIGALLPQPDGTHKEIVRSYTPISGDHQPGFFDLLIKSYPQGNITQHLDKLSLGQTIRVRGPKGAFKYRPNMVRHIGMIAGGTGITPMLQIIYAVKRGRASGDRTEIDLIFANVDVGDILLKEELDAIVKDDDGIRVHYVLNNPPSGWTGGVGFVNADMISVSLSLIVHPSCDRFANDFTEMVAQACVRCEGSALWTASDGWWNEEDH